MVIIRDGAPLVYTSILPYLGMQMAGMAVYRHTGNALP